GGPFSPLNDDESQIELIRHLGLPTILVGPSTVGAIGRCRAMLRALRGDGIVLRAIVLVGPEDSDAETEIARDGVAVIGIRGPGEGSWTTERLRESVAKDAAVFDA